MGSLDFLLTGCLLAKVVSNFSLVFTKNIWSNVWKIEKSETANRGVL